MKKFFSILCALTMVLSVSAAPVAKKMQAAKFQSTVAKQLSTEKKAPTKKVVKKANTLVMAEKAVAPAFRAPKVKAEAIDVTCGSWDIEDWGTDGELYLYGADNTYAFYFDLIYGEGASDLVLGQTYTAEDIYVGADGQYGGVFYDGDWHYGIKQLSLVKTVDGEGLVHFVGSCIDSLDAAFSFHYDETPFVPTGEEVEHSFVKSATLSYSKSYKDWTIKVSDAAYALKLDIFSEDSLSAVGEYSSKNGDFDVDYTNVEIKITPDSSILYQPHSATASITERNDSIFIHAEIMAENGVLYKFDAFNAAPQKQGEAAIIATNLVLDDSWYGYFGVAWADASNDDYAVSLTLSNLTGALVAGTDFRGSITNKATGEEAEIYSGSITISNIGGLLISGTVLCYDNIEYTLNLAYVLPEPGREETINGAGYLYLENQSGMLYWQAVAMNQAQDRYVSLLAISDVTAGTYTLEDLYAQYTYVGVFTAPSDTAWYDIIDANITVAVNGDAATIIGTLLGQNASDDSDIVKFTLNLNLQVVDETGGGETGNQYDSQDEGFYYKFPTYNIDDQYLAKYNVFVVGAQDAENHTISIEINVEAGTTELAAGVYPINDTYAAGTVTNGTVDQYIYGSFAGSLDDEGYINVPLWLLNAGTVTVTESGVIEVEATNTWGREIKCRLGEYPEGIENTDAKAAAVKVVRDGKLIIIKNGVEFNAQGTIVK